MSRVAWFSGPALNVEEGIHFRWHLLARGRGDVAVELYDDRGRPEQRCELPPATGRAGWAVTVTGGGGADDGVDLMLSKPRGLRVVVSCKHYRARLGVPQVREVVGVAYHYKARGAYVVALGGFTKAAREYADGKPIKLIDGAALLRWMNR